MKTNTVKLHQVFTAPPEKLFRAFSEAHALAAWIPPYGFTATVQQHEFKIGGHFRMAFTNFTTAKEEWFGGQYLDIIPNQRLQYTDVFDDPNLAGHMLTTIEFKAVRCGTELNISQEGIPEVIPVELCYLGWQESLDKLKRLVEPHIPDA